MPIVSDDEFLSGPQGAAAPPAAPPVAGSPTTVRFSDNTYAADVSNGGSQIPPNAVRLGEGQAAPPPGTPYVTPGGVLWSNGVQADTPHPAPGPLSDADFLGSSQAAPVASPQVPTHPDQGLGFLTGLERPLDNVSQWAASGLDKVANGLLSIPGVSQANDAIAHATGLPDTAQAQAGGGFSGSVAQANAAHQADLASQAAHGVVPGKWGEFGGGLLAAIPAAAITKNPFIAGGIIGATQTEHPNDAKRVAIDTAVGGLLGKLGDVTINKVGAAVAPRFSQAVQGLLGEGVHLTPGQTLGGVAHRIEDGLTHVPLLGDLIKNSQAQSVESFNAAALNRVLAPLGETLPKDVKVGNEGVEYATNRLSQAYQDLLPQLTIRADPELAMGVKSLADKAAMLPEAQQKQYAAILANWVQRPFQQGGMSMTGTAMKQADGEIGRLASAYSGSADAGQRELGMMLRDLQGELRASVQRSNPQQAPILDAINKGWAQLVRVHGASASTNAASHGGVFTASQLLNAVKSADKSGRKAAFAQGNALMQDLAQNGTSVLPSTVPDSGTAGRGLLTGLLLGGGHAVHTLVHPATGIPLGLLSSAYTKAGQKVVTGLLTARPAWAPAARKAVSQLKAPAVVLGAQATQPVSQGLLPSPAP